MGEPARWGRWGSQAGEVADDEFFEWEPEGHSGERSVSIREEGWGRRGWWYTVVRGIKPRRWYSVSVWAKRDRPTGWVPELELFGQRRVMNLYDAGVWQKFDWLLDSREFEGDVVLRLINCRKPHKVCFDDVVVEEFWLEGDTEVEQRKLSWRCSETSALVVFQVEAARSEQFVGNTFVLGKTLNNEFRIPPGVPEGVWYWRVKAFQNETQLAVSQPRSANVEADDDGIRETLSGAMEVLPPNRPASSECVSFDRDLNIVVDGKPFFPLGIYSLPPAKFREARKAGFNAVLTGEVEAARRAGLRAIVPRGFRIAPKNGRSPRGASASKGKCSVIARYLSDEPDQNNVSPRDVFQAHVDEKTADPHHPTAVVVYRPENFPAYASVSDILMTDPYPMPHRPVSVVSESVRAARRAVRDRKPVWAVIQAFNWMDVSQEARRTGWARWPTYEEERCMAYLAAINGARGILFFEYRGEGKHDPVNWHALKRLAAELNKLSPILLSRTVAVPVSVEVQRLRQPNGKDESNTIEHTLKTCGHSTYLIAANNWPGARRVTFSFGADICRVINVPLERRRIRGQRGSFSDVFAAYGVHVYELRFQRPAGRP